MSTLCSHAGDLRHEPISRVIDVSCYAPPSRCDQLCASLSLECLQMPDRWMIRVIPKCILLRVGTPECTVANCFQAQDAKQPNIGNCLHHIQRHTSLTYHPTDRAASDGQNCQLLQICCDSMHIANSCCMCDMTGMCNNCLKRTAHCQS